MSQKESSTDLNESSFSSDDQESITALDSTNSLSHHDSLIIDSISKRRETEMLDNQTASLRKLKLFPIFGDQKLAQISVNYFLYLEFFHGIIRIFTGILIFTILMSLLSWIIFKMAPSEYIPDLVIVLPMCFHLSILFLFVFLPRRELQYILQEKALYEFQWSEDAFSVLVEGLPVDATQEEIASYFHSILSYKGDVVDIIYVQDYRKYMTLKNELGNLNKKLKKANHQEKIKENIMNKIQVLESQINQITEEFNQMKHYGGKAIVIFDTIWAQNQVIKHFSYGYFKGLLIRCFKSCFNQKYYFRNHRIIAKTLPEPRDLHFQNLYYSSSSKRIRRIFARLITALLVQLLFAGINSMKDIKTKTYSTLISWLSSIGIVLATTIMEAVFKYLQRFYINRSALEDKLGGLEYYFAVSTILYNATLLVPVPNDLEAFYSSLLRLILLFGAKFILLQFIGIYSTAKSLKNYSEKTSNSLVRGLMGKAREKYIEFDFIKGLSRTLPPLIIGFVLFAINPFVLLPLLIIILYITAILDKYRIIKTCNLFSAKSAYFMLKPFYLYKWIIILGFMFTFIRINFTSPELFLIPDAIAWILGISGLGMIIAHFSNPPLDETVKEKFIELNANVRYESVCGKFSSSFRKKDPYHRNKFTSSKNKLHNDIL